MTQWTQDPKPGDEVYVPTSWYLSRGADDVLGGLATVERTEHKWGSLWLYTKEIPGRGYNWTCLIGRQALLKETYGDRRARPDPDYHQHRTSANTGGL